MNKEELKIVFLGTPDFAVATLDALVKNNFNIVAVVTMPDKPAGRGLQLNESAVKKYAIAHNIPVLQPLKLKDEIFLSELKSYKADLQVVVAFRMLPEPVWNMPQFGTYNVHASLLPQYRGAAPINRAIMNGEVETGVTTFKLVHEIDKGNILLQAKIQISDEDNAGTIHNKLMILGGELMVETIEKLLENKLEEIPQQQIDESSLKHAPKIFTVDCEINWNKSANEIFNQIRGLSPYPGAITKLNGKILKIFDCSFFIEKHSYEVGKFVSNNKNEIKITCADGFISLKTIQLEGKRKMYTQEFLNGYKF